MDDSQTKRYVEEIERIIRAHNPAFDELYTTLDRLKHLCDLTKQAEQKPSLTFQEKLVLKRMDELIRIQLDDMGWKYQHSSIYEFMRQHLLFRQLWFQQILTDEEAASVQQEIELLLQQPPFNEHQS